jgi:hypothetical protein
MSSACFRDGRFGAFDALSLCPLSRASRPFISSIFKVCSGSRNYGDGDKGLAPLSLCESR